MHTPLQRSEKDFSVLFDARLVHWVTVALEVAELCSKVLDWKVPDKAEPQLQGTEDLALSVCKSYLQLVEEISLQVNELGG